MDEEITDIGLVERVRSGERDAYAELVRRHHARIFGLCASMLGERTQAEDAAQEAFLKAFRSLPGFKGDSSFSSWLYRIAANQCLDFLRRRAREKSDSLDAILEGEGGGLQSLLGAAPDASRAVENADLAERVLARLPPQYRLILTLREVQGLSYREVAEAMDCTVDSVKARLQRARQSLEGLVRHLMKPDNV